MMDWLPRLVARVRASIHAKLLTAFLTIVVLLIIVGAVAVRLLNEANRRAEDLVKLQHKIAAYRQLQHDTTRQLSSVTTALLLPDEQTLEATLHQLNEFKYDVDRLLFVAKDETELLGQVEGEYEQFINVVTEAVEHIRRGKTAEGRELQVTQLTPLAEGLERLTNELVNRAEADMVVRVEASHEAYVTSRWVVIVFAVGSVVLALVLGYAISWSLIDPVQRMETRFREIASGDFSRRVEIDNRDEVGGLAANLNRMNDELERLYQQLELANKHKSQFLANMSHEIRTPLNAIIGFTRLVLRKTEGQIPTLQRENLQKVLISAEHLLHLVNGLLDLSKIEAGRIEVFPEPFELADVVHVAAATVEPMFKDGRVHLITEIDSNMPRLNTDREKLQQIILNLLTNAAKFTEDGEIKISAWGENGWLKFLIADTGIGIPEEALHHIFDEFHQADVATKRHGGSGLGLAIVKKLVGLLGGDIAVESQVGKGSMFTVTLPMHLKG